VKAVAGVVTHDPWRKVKVPAPTYEPAGIVADDTDCCFANTSTSKLNDVAFAVELALMVAAAVLDEDELRAVHALLDAMALAASARAENCD
jgi:hypothetical protein